MWWKLALVLLLLLLLAACRTTFTRDHATGDKAVSIATPTIAEGGLVATVEQSVIVTPSETNVEADLGILPAPPVVSEPSPNADLVAAGCIDPAGGHASAACAAEQQILATAQCRVVSADGDVVNVRSGPGLNFEVAAGLPGGRQLAAEAKTDTGWYQVDGVVQGWVFSGVVAPQGQCDLLYTISVPDALGACFRVGYGIGSPHGLYDGPSHTDGTLIGQVDAGVAVAVVGRSEERLQLEDLGWVNNGTGELDGDCENVPFTQVRPAAPGGICSLYIPASTSAPTAIYSGSSQGMGALVGQLTPGDYLQVVARGTRGGYKVGLNDGATGWAQVPQQMISATNLLYGPCDNLPLEEETVSMG